MTRPIIHLIRGHTGTGAVVGNLVESEICGRVVEACSDRLLALGVEHEVRRELTSGERRHEVAVQAQGQGEILAVEVHADVGGGRCGRVFFASGSGGQWARRISDSAKWTKVMPELATMRWPRVADALSWSLHTPRTCRAVLVELGYLDQPSHAHLWDSPETTGAMLADALKAALEAT